VDFRVKPDVTAPGVNVLSSIPGTGPESCNVTMSAAKGASLDAHQAMLRFDGLAHAALFTWIKQ
jgi:hypothetical protein